MKLIFLSNYYNHHQGPLCEAIAAKTDVDFQLVVCGVMTEERQKMWGRTEKLPRFVTEPKSQADWDKTLHDVFEADAVIIGSAPQALLKERLSAGKLILRYQERPLKNGVEPLKFLPRMLKWHLWNPPGKPVYLLCASAYASQDYKKMGLFRGKTYKWGYFPETRSYDCQALLAQKELNSIFWAGRFLNWKHPDDALQVAARLRDEGCSFKLRMAGSGILEGQLRNMITELNLGDCVELLGSLKPEQVRCEMEHSKIFLFTSDQHEGWGAVLNEAMNSGCAVIASDAAGATPYLVENGVNGCIYQSRNTNEMYEKIVSLLEQPSEQERLGKAAYETITTTWNAKVAAERLCDLLRSMIAGESSPELYKEGPCSRA